VTLKTDLPRAIRPAMTDANQLELAILNLAVNARDAMARAARSASAWAKRASKPGGRFRPDGDYVA